MFTINFDNTWLTWALIIGLSLTVLCSIGSALLLYFSSKDYYYVRQEAFQLRADRLEFENILKESSTAMLNVDRPRNLEVLRMNNEYNFRVN